MTKVEELEKEVCSYYTDPWYYEVAFAAVKKLIAAAREEGAEAKTLEILNASNGFAAGAAVNDGNYIFTDGDGTSIAGCELYVVPWTALAPKESEHE